MSSPRKNTAPVTPKASRIKREDTSFALSSPNYENERSIVERMGGLKLNEEPANVSVKILKGSSKRSVRKTTPLRRGDIGLTHINDQFVSILKYFVGWDSEEECDRIFSWESRQKGFNFIYKIDHHTGRIDYYQDADGGSLTNYKADSQTQTLTNPSGSLVQLLDSFEAAKQDLERKALEVDEQNQIMSELFNAADRAIVYYGNETSSVSQNAESQTQPTNETSGSSNETQNTLDSFAFYEPLMEDYEAGPSNALPESDPRQPQSGTESSDLPHANMLSSTSGRSNSPSQIPFVVEPVGPHSPSRVTIQVPVGIVTQSELDKYVKGFKTKYNDQTDRSLEVFCSECKKLQKTITPSSLKRHLSGHLKIKDFNCKVCLTGFVTKDQLIKHMLTHPNYDG